jgi:hypothetical protein
MNKATLEKCNRLQSQIERIENALSFLEEEQSFIKVCKREETSISALHNIGSTEDIWLHPTQGKESLKKYLTSTLEELKNEFALL